jgi:hypothetical protein
MLFNSIVFIGKLMKNKYNKFFLNNNYIFDIVNLVGLLLLTFFYNLNALARINQVKAPQENKFIAQHLAIFLDVNQHGSTSNTIYSPVSIQNNLIVYINIMCGNYAEFAIKELNDLGIYGYKQMCFSDNSDSLQYLTAILTKNYITEIQKKQLYGLNILVGDPLLCSDLQMDLPEEFRQQFNMVFNKIFGSTKLSETIFFDDLRNTSPYNLKIVSAIKFYGYLEYGYFSSIGNKSFLTENNKKITTEFLFAKINNTKIIYKDGWKAVRLLYKGKYSIDIILPKKANKYSTAKQNQVIYKLIKLLGDEANNNYNNIVKISIPKFTIKQAVDVNIETIYNLFSENDIAKFKKFFNIPNDTSLFKLHSTCCFDIDKQEVLDKKLTTKRSTTFSSFFKTKKFNVNRPFFFVISEVRPVVDKSNNYKRSYIINNILMIGKIKDPSIKEKD